MLRLAIVGMGWAGTRQAQAVRELGREITLACLVDSDAAHLAERAATFGVDKTSTDYEAVLADPAIGAVTLCTPHALHGTMALQAAEAGKHILVEKPMALAVEEATLMIAAAGGAGVTLNVAENAVYTPLARTLREIVQTARVTSPSHPTAWSRGGAFPRRPSIRWSNASLPHVSEIGVITREPDRPHPSRSRPGPLGRGRQHPLA